MSEPARYPFYDGHVQERDRRADGRCACRTCGKLYRQHPMDRNELSGIDGESYLHLLCDGTRVKL